MTSVRQDTNFRTPMRMDIAEGFRLYEKGYNGSRAVASFGPEGHGRGGVYTVHVVDAGGSGLKQPTKGLSTTKVDTTTSIEKKPVVDAGGFEPPASSLQTKHSSN